MNRRRIGYLVPEFPGQTHIFFWREIAELEKLGAEVVLISTKTPRQRLISHNWSQDAMARTFYLLPVSAGDGLAALCHLPVPTLIEALGEKLPAGDDRKAFLKDTAMSLPLAAKLRAFCKAQGIDHLHAHSCGRGATIARLCYRMGGPRYSLTLHGPLKDYGPGQSYKWRDAVFVSIITRQLLDEARAKLDLPDGLRLPVQAMGVDTEYLRRDRPYQPYVLTPDTSGPDTSGQGPLEVFSCARLNLVKGHQDAIRAVAALVAEGLDVRLTIAGEDDMGGAGYRATLEALIAELGLGARVVLLGAVDHEEVRRRLLAAHVFVLASWAEPLGVAYMEAMSCAVPVIGTRAGGVPELIDDGVDGVLVPPKDVEALREAILGLARDPDRAAAIAAAGREKIVAQFSARRGAEMLLAESAKQ